MPAGVRICRIAAAAALCGGFLGALGAISGCRADPPQISFEAPTPQGRAAAVARAAREQDPRSIPDLIKALDDDDPVIRSWAIRGLEEMTGETHGYDPFAPQGPRDQAIERWVRWYRAGGEADIVDGAEIEDPTRPSDD